MMGSRADGGGGLGGGFVDAFKATIGVGLFLLLGIRSMVAIIAAVAIGMLTMAIVQGAGHIHKYGRLKVLFTVGSLIYDISGALGYYTFFAMALFPGNFTAGVIAAAVVSIVGVVTLAMIEKADKLFRAMKFAYTLALLVLVPVLGIYGVTERSLSAIMGILIFAYVGFSPLVAATKSGKGLGDYIIGVILGFMAIMGIMAMYLAMPGLSLAPGLGTALVAINGLLAFVAFADGTRRNIENLTIPQWLSPLIIVSGTGFSEANLESQLIPSWLALAIVIVLEIGLASFTLILRLIPITYFAAAGYMGGLAQYLALALATIWGRKSSG